jgi:hypothetical protein
VYRGGTPTTRARPDGALRAASDALFRVVLNPVNARRTPLRRETFEAWDGPLPYFVHTYNATWRNERAVEIPFAQDFLRRHGSGAGAEIGNVLSWYGIRDRWEVVDRYELGKGVRNIDVLEYRPATPLDFIVAISTLEHVGWDELPQEPDKPVRAFHHLRSLLAPGGALFLTVPFGHNPALDEAIVEGLPVTRQLTMVMQPDGRWQRSDTVTQRPYIGRRGRGAGSVWVAEVEAAG